MSGIIVRIGAFVDAVMSQIIADSMNVSLWIWVLFILVNIFGFAISSYLGFSAGYKAGIDAAFSGLESEMRARDALALGNPNGKSSGVENSGINWPRE